MKIIYLDRVDGARHCVGAVEDSFDVQSWANSRKGSFALLEIVRVSVAEMPQHFGKKEVDFQGARAHNINTEANN